MNQDDVSVANPNAAISGAMAIAITTVTLPGLPLAVHRNTRRTDRESQATHSTMLSNTPHVRAGRNTTDLRNN